ncbi:hypothetical protein GCM10020220_020800 [Nonomuraea rubra]
MRRIAQLLGKRFPERRRVKHSTAGHEKRGLPTRLQTAGRPPRTARTRLRLRAHPRSPARMPGPVLRRAAAMKLSPEPAAQEKRRYGCTPSTRPRSGGWML